MITVLTGLQNDNIKIDLQPYRLQPTTSDELLLERPNMACANEKETQEEKRQTAQSDASGDKKCTAQQNIATRPSDMLSDLKDIKADCWKISRQRYHKSESPAIRQKLHHSCILLSTKERSMWQRNTQLILSHISQPGMESYRLSTTKGTTTGVRSCRWPKVHGWTCTVSAAVCATKIPNAMSLTKMCNVPAVRWGILPALLQMWDVFSIACAEVLALLDPQAMFLSSVYSSYLNKNILFILEKMLPDFYLLRAHYVSYILTKYWAHTEPALDVGMPWSLFYIDSIFQTFFLV